MNKKRSILRRLIPWIIVLLALGALILFVFVPIYSGEEKSFGRDTRLIYFEGDEKPLIMENDQLLFEMDGATTLFTVTNKQTGKVWHSNPENRDNDSMTSGELKEALSSTLKIAYYDGTTRNEWNNFTYSIKNQGFEARQMEDGSIRVTYSMGKNAGKRYLIPNAITKERYDAFLEKLGKSDKNSIKSKYTLWEPAKLDSKDNKDEIIAMFPSVQEQALYILKSSVTHDQKASLEVAFAKAGYSEEDYEIDQSLMVGETEHGGAIFDVTMVYRLEENDLVVEIPYSDVCCGADYPIVYLYPLPMFGAADKTQAGFSLVPEGGGAIINFNNGKSDLPIYYADMYGYDFCITGQEMSNEQKNTFPVFGMSYEDGAFICIMEGAESYGGVYAKVSGLLNDYNVAYARYSVLHFDSMKVDSSVSAGLMLVFEDAIPDDTLVQRYRFLDEGGYVGMAKAYGEYLRNQPEMKEETASEEMPVTVEVVGAIDKMEVKAGLPVHSIIPVTTFDQASRIMDELVDSGIKDLNMRFTGWCNGGVKQQVLTGIHVEGCLGGESGMKRLMEAARARDVDLFFDGISCFAYDSDFLDGFVTLSDAARTTTRAIVKLYPYDIVTFLQSDWMDPFYLVKAQYAQNCASNLVNGLRERNAVGVAFRDIGNLLSADYHDSSLTTREQAKAMNVQTLQDAVNAGLKVIIKEGNAYALPYADVITDMSLTGNAYALLDDKVPFYQIALHGLKNYTGEALNLSGDYRTLLLESAEYGAGLNFTFMEGDTKVLQDSVFSGYRAANYGAWRDEAIGIITRYQKDMAGLNRQSIVNHEQLTEKVSVTTYADGTKVYVNYSTIDYTEGTVRVPARDYLVERGSGE